MSFADLGVSPVVVRALRDRGIETPFAIQKLVVADVLAGRDVLAQSPTGSGKTLAFGVPLVDRVEADHPRPSALILAPTRELATQIAEELIPLAHARALSVAAVYGGAGMQPQIKRARKAHIVVATPGRLEDLLERRAITLEKIRVLILDEADRMLDMGFKPVVDRLVRQMPRQRQTLFFSATLEGEAGRVAASYTRDAVRHEHHAPEQARGKTDHRFIAVEHAAKLDTLVHELRHTERGRTLVFVRTKRGADRLVKRLRNHDVTAVAMHGDKSQAQRERALASFDAGKVDTLIATDVAARGIDVDDVTHIINFDAPEDRDGYVHRVGRTARAGRTGVGITFVLGDQAADVGKIARSLDLVEEFTASGLSLAASPTRGRQPQGGRGPKRQGGPRQAYSARPGTRRRSRRSGASSRGTAR